MRDLDPDLSYRERLHAALSQWAAAHNVLGQVTTLSVGFGGPPTMEWPRAITDRGAPRYRPWSFRCRPDRGTDGLVTV